MLEDSVKKIVEGIRVDNYLIYAKSVSEGRIRGEVTLDIFLKRENHESQILYITVFYGRMPIYKPWIEFFSISDRIEIGGKVIGYFDSFFEDKLLEFFSQSIEPGGKIYVEYYNDRETAQALIYDVPPPITRLGYKLFNLGFTWFKDWYFPEGFSEGGQKLQGEKPINDETRMRHSKNIYDGIKNFVKSMESNVNPEWYMIKAIARAEKILTQLEYLH